MKKSLKIISLLMIITCCFLLTGCGSKEKEDKEVRFEVKQVDEKNVHVEVNNLPTGEVKSATIEVSEGESIITSYNLEETAGLKVSQYLVEGDEKQDYGYEVLIGEDGESSMSEIPVGTYELVFEADSAGVSGIIDITAK